MECTPMPGLQAPLPRFPLARLLLLLLLLLLPDETHCHAAHLLDPSKSLMGY